MWYRFGSGIVAAVFASLLVVTSVSGVRAQGSGEEQVASLPAADPAQAVAEFLESPNRLLTTNPEGGDEMVDLVRLLAVTDEATVDVILSLLPVANDEQKKAIGEGLARAVEELAESDPEATALIQNAVADANDQVVIEAFLIGTEETATAAVPGGAGGATGGIGQTGGGPGTAFSSTGISGNSSFSITGGGSSSRNSTETSRVSGSTSASTL